MCRSLIKLGLSITASVRERVVAATVRAESDLERRAARDLQSLAFGQKGKPLGTHPIDRRVSNIAVIPPCGPLRVFVNPRINRAERVAG